MENKKNISQAWLGLLILPLFMSFILVKPNMSLLATIFSSIILIASVITIFYIANKESKKNKKIFLAIQGFLLLSVMGYLIIRCQ